MISFDPAHRAVHYPPDRRFRIWIRPSILIGIGIAILSVIAASWIEVAVAGLPHVPAVPQIYPDNFAGPHGFPVWVRYYHFFNFLFVMMLIRSGLSILMDHPRLYFNDGCTPGSEWIRLTPLEVPRDRIWTAKDDARYISPLVGTPGYRHTIGIARVWHFINVHGFIITGILFVIMLFDTEQWRRIVPTSPLVLLQAWNTWVHYATFHLPPEPNGFYGYNALQQIAYFTVVFVFGPLAILTGIAMSPAVVNRFPWYARIFGGRQSARSIHFLTMFSFLAFLVVHVTLIVMTGFARNMNHIVLGTDDQTSLGMYLGFVGIGVVLLSWIVAYYISWNQPRRLQRALKSVTYPMQLLTLNRLTPQQKYAEKDISPYFWPNGKMPIRDDWKRLAETGFEHFRLKVGGLVERPVELSLADLEKLGETEHITMHHCIQGWSGIARWGGIPMKALIDLVEPKPEARVVAFFSFGEALYGGPYYDTQSLENVLKPQCLLASRMNGLPLPQVYGAPLRLRVENQLGYKMVKWIERIEFYRVGENAWRRRRRQKRRRRIFRPAAQHLMRKRSSPAQPHAGADHVVSLLRRVRLDWLLQHFPPRLVQSVYVFVNGFITIGVLALLALVSRNPFVFPSLGPTAYLLFFSPLAKTSSPRNTIFGHAIGLICGYAAFVVTGAGALPFGVHEGIFWPRILAAALSLSVTGACMVLLDVSHPPAGATTLIVSLGIISKPRELLIIEVAVFLLVAQALVINRLAGLPYPMWNAAASINPVNED